MGRPSVPIINFGGSKDDIIFARGRHKARGGKGTQGRRERFDVAWR